MDRSFVLPLMSALVMGAGCASEGGEQTPEPEPAPASPLGVWDATSSQNGEDYTALPASQEYSYDGVPSTVTVGVWMYIGENRASAAQYYRVESSDGAYECTEDAQEGTWSDMGDGRFEIQWDSADAMDFSCTVDGDALSCEAANPDPAEPPMLLLLERSDREVPEVCEEPAGDPDPDPEADEVVQFGEDFVEAYCAAWDQCRTGGDPCPATSGGGDSSGCDFNAAAAEACLQGEFMCDDSLGAGEEFPLPPAVCAEVCG